MSEQTTFASLDRLQGIPEPLPSTEEEYPLPAWYRTVRNKPLDDLGIGDVCKALQQNIHVKYIIPVALKQLQLDPLAGDMYDGEILASLRLTAADYWLEHPAESSIFRQLLEAVLLKPDLEDTIRKDAEELLRKVTLA